MNGKIFSFAFLAFAIVAATGTSLVAQPNDDFRVRIGYYDLLAEFGSIEDGTGFSVSMVEADSNGDDMLFSYMPNGTITSLADVLFIDASGLQNTTPSSHATNMARILAGDTGISQGVAQVTVFEAGDYIDRVLGFQTGAEPLSMPFLVQNHSWAGNFTGPGADLAATETLQRLDYLIERDGVSMAVGLFNNSASPHPQLLAQSYNAISVGRVTGQHSQGTTTIYGAGRVKPDIVSSANTTSGATAEVSSVLTVLHHKAANEGNADAHRPETMKSILLAGASKEPFPDWDRTTTRPLDEVFGAGEVNLYNSYKILDAGEFDGSGDINAPALVGPAGYDYGESLDDGESLFYGFEVGPGEEWRDVSLLVTWNRQIIDGDSGSLFDPVALDLADMSLFLYDATGAPVLLDASMSPVNNVEHIFIDSLGPGFYTFEVTTSLLTDFGLAWYARAVPEPSSGLLLVTGVAGWLATRRRRRG